MRILGFFFLLGLTSCGSPPSDNSSEQQRIGASPSGSPQQVNQAVATRSAFEEDGLEWPLTVEAGQLGCTQLARWVEVDGIRYGLNGVATTARGYEEIEPIWRIDEIMADALAEHGAPNDPPIRISISDMIAEAGKFC